VGLTHLELTDFRVFTTTRFDPDPDGTTVLMGPNGTGKTSLLEAIGYLGLGRSLRGSPREAMIRNGASSAIIRAEVVFAGRELLVEAELARVGRSRIQVNRQPARSRRDLAQAVPVSTFCPDDLAVVQGGPSGRRDLLDDALVLLEPGAGPLIEEVDKTLRQRNALLRQASGRLSPEIETTLEVWDDRLSRAGDQLVGLRRDLLDRLSLPIDRAYQTLAGTAGPATVGVGYEGTPRDGLCELLMESRRDDLRRGVTTVGPHRDDVTLELNGRDARTQASQGEQRTLALAVRLAIHLAAREHLGGAPLLLLDDVFSELDPDRARRLVNEFPPGQTLVTTASPLPEGVHPALVLDVAALVHAGG
jgi:DNA replication and repair protein RecF